MNSSPVIDISHWQDDPIDWVAMKASGVVGVIHKATEGTSYVDPKLFKRAAAAINAGLLWSTYHFMRPGSMQAQIDHYLETVNPVPGERVCLDHEDAGVGLDELEDAVLYINAKRSDLEIAIYSGHLIKEQLGSARSDILAGTSLWIAHYTSSTAPKWPVETWPLWDLWQWTDQGKAAGIGGNVDLNRWGWGPELLPAWFGATPAPPDAAEIWTCPQDGFTGTKIGEYTTLEGNEGLVLQLINTKVVHVYGKHRLTRAG